MDVGLLKEKIGNLKTDCETNGIPLIIVVDVPNEPVIRLWNANGNTAIDFRALITMVGTPNKGHIDDDVKRFVDVYIVSRVNEPSTEQQDTSVELTQHLSNLAQEINTMISTHRWHHPWFVCYRIIANSTVKQVTVSGLMLFKQYPVYNVVQYLAYYGSIEEAAVKFNKATTDVNTTDYKLFKDYL